MIVAEQTEMQLLPETPQGMEHAPAQMVQIAPGRWVPKHKSQAVPETVLCMVQPDGRGGYTLLPQWDQYIRLSQKVLNRLGMVGGYRTMLRLVNAGFVDGRRVAPNTTLLNLTSWSLHLHRTAEDPEFWAKDGQNLPKYLKVLDY